MANISLITPEEHQKFLSFIPPKVKSLCYAVARLYLLESNNWRYFDTGLISMTKDNERRNYYLQLFNMDKCQLSREIEVTCDSAYTVHSNQVHYISTKGSVLLLSFADLSESIKFSNEVINVIKTRKEQREKKRQSHMNPNGNVITSSIPAISSNAVRTETRAVPNRKVEGKKLTKADISGPSNFQHLDHMGINEHFFNNPNDENLRKYLKGSGFEKLLDNDKSKQAIYDFVEKEGGFKKFESEMKQMENKERKAPSVPKPAVPPNAPQKQPPPPPPSRPPPNVYMPPTNVPQKPVPSAGVPPPPPAPAPAPPPPAPGLPAMPKPSQNKPAASDSRGDLLSEICKFDPKKLKANAQANEKQAPKNKDVSDTASSGAGGSILESLAAFLQDRQNIMQAEDSDDSDNDDNDDDQWND